MSRRLRIARSASVTIELAACSARPAEACGLLLGRRRGAGWAVLEALPAPNLAVARTRFEVDPGAVVAAEDRARPLGWELVGVWHTHPDRPALLSAADRREGFEGWIHAVRGLDGLRAWSIAAGAPHELALELVDEGHAGE